MCSERIHLKFDLIVVYNHLFGFKINTNCTDRWELLILVCRCVSGKQIRLSNICKSWQDRVSLKWVLTKFILQNYLTCVSNHQDLDQHFVRHDQNKAPKGITVQNGVVNQISQQSVQMCVRFPDLRFPFSRPLLHIPYHSITKVCVTM